MGARSLRAPFVLRTFPPRNGGNPAALSPEHTPVFALLRVPFRCAKGDCERHVRLSDGFGQNGDVWLMGNQFEDWAVEAEEVEFAVVVGSD